jgi:two-component system cell cycle sensor histidine kinase/response regulator CckA
LFVASGAVKRAALPASKVLLVDDDPDYADLMRELLVELGEGYELVTATDIDGALRAIRQEAPDVMLLDLNLGDRSGLELLGLLEDVTAAPPCVVLTGHGDRAFEKQALAAGATDYLVKTRMDHETLSRALRHAMQRKSALEAVRERDRLFRAVFEASYDAFLITDDRGRYVDGNAAALGMLGLTRSELIGRSVADLAPPGQRSALEARFKQFLSVGETSGELQLRGKGDIVTVDFRAKANILPGRHMTILRDVKPAQERDALRARLAAIVSSAQDGIIGWNLDGRVTDWNACAETLFGIPASVAVGRPFAEFVPEAAQPGVFAGESVRNVERVHVLPDGRKVALSINTAPIYGEDGQVVGASTIARDITETQTLRSQVAITDRLSSLGLLAAGVAHEINNPLAAVIACIEATVAELGDVPTEHSIEQMTSDLGNALTAAGRVRNIVRDLKLFSRPGDVEREPVDVEQILESALRMVSNETRHRARVERIYSGPPRVLANESRLAQVFLNLVVNAAQSIPEGAAERNRITIATGERDGKVMVEIRDTGCGISPEHLPRIFEPFFTTKPVGIGTGLGLAICHGIVTSFGGEIAFESTVGQGTTCRVLLPPAREKPAEDKAVERVRPPREHRPRVLVVDDEPVIAQLLARLLRQQYDVVAVSKAREALDLVRGGKQFDAVLCDLMMPDMTGMDLDAALQEIDSTWRNRIGFLSGGIFTERGLAFVSGCDRPQLEKPFTSAELESFLEAVLDRSRPTRVQQ